MIGSILKIVEMIIEFFRNSLSQKRDNTLVDGAAKSATDSVILAVNTDTLNKKEKLEIDLQTLRKVQKENIKAQNKKPVDEQFDEQFGKDE